MKNKTIVGNFVYKELEKELNAFYNVAVNNTDRIDLKIELAVLYKVLIDKIKSMELDIKEKRLDNY